MAGFALYVGAGFQQAGIKTTSAGNAGFITSLDVVIVPLLLWAFWKESPSALTVLAVLTAIGGAFLLSTSGSFQVKPGDILIFFGSLFWAVQVVVVSRVKDKMKAIPFALGQYAVCSLLNLLTGSLIEHPSQQDMLAILPAILYTGVFSVAIGFTLQVVAQRHTPANDATLIMSLEAVFAALFGWIFLHETLLPVQIAGCALILAAVVLVQVKNGKMQGL